MKRIFNVGPGQRGINAGDYKLIVLCEYKRMAREFIPVAGLETCLRVLSIQDSLGQTAICADPLTPNGLACVSFHAAPET